ncbi:MAG: translation initiation factor IF-2 [Cytophagales bacterium]|nr:MAG: translation initiation factor IF-2 [Cytophagales bacterium]
MEEKVKRLSQAAKELNVSVSTIVEHLSNKYHQKLENNPNGKLTIEQFNLLSKDFESSMMTKKEARNLNIGKSQGENIVIKSTPHQEKRKEEEEQEIFIKNNFIVENKEKNPFSNQNKNDQEKPKKEVEVIKAKLPGLTVVDKIDLSAKQQPKTDYKQQNYQSYNKNNNNNNFNSKSKDNPIKPIEQPIKKVEEQQVKNAEVKLTPKEELKHPIIEKTVIVPVELNTQEVIVPTITEKTPPKEEVKTQNDKPINPPIIDKDEQVVVSEVPHKETTHLQNKSENKDIEPMEKNLMIENDSLEVRKTTTVSDILKTAKFNRDKNIESSPEEILNLNKEVIEAKADALPGLKIVGKIELPDPRAKKKPKPIASSDDNAGKEKRKRKRKRIRDKEKEVRLNTPNTPQDPNKKVEVQKVNNVFTQNKNQSNNTNNNNNRSNTTTNNNSSNNNNNRNNTTTNNNSNRSNTTTNNSSNNNNNRNNTTTNNNNRSNTTNNNSSNNNNNRNNTTTNNNNNPNNRVDFKRDKPVREEISEKEIQEKIKNTLAILHTSSKGPKQTFGKKQKKEKLRNAVARNQELIQQEKDKKLLKVTEFISANDLATLLHISVNEIIAKCLSFGMFVAINQRLDAEAITFIADEFGYDVEFISAEQEIAVTFVQQDRPEDLISRAPIVTIMGHVDHGKTSLLDFIRQTNVTQGEAGGITQHIGAYDVMTSSGKRITFLDTPGHEAFTAMRARGAKVTDVAVIVVAADDSVMPQTIEAINHAQVAGVPMIFAINKIDKPGANPSKIKEALSAMNYLVEDWGGKYQCQEISAKKGLGIEDLLEKILIEAEMLELKANPNKGAVGTVIEASLDKGKGYVATVLVESGTLKIGDMLLAGSHYGKVKAMLDYKGNKLTHAGPSTPVQVLGLNGAPQAGDKLNVTNEREAKEIATRREQILREQSIRAIKRTTLNDLGRRIALGFKQLNVIVKADVDGSVEALSDALLKLSRETVEVQILHKGVGQISESDVTLATTSDAIIIGFQVRPSVNARKLADKEGVEIRMYSIIYDAINEVKDALEGMLAPTFEEVILGNAEVREVFKITKIGTVAGCYITEGSIKRNGRVRIIRDGIVVYGGGENGSGEISALKRFKDDVSEVKTNYECGISVKNFNDIQIGDIIEAYEQKEVKRKLT